MSNKQRPALERKVTRGSEKKRKDSLDIGLTVKVDGTEYTIRDGDMTAMDTMALRKETGYSFRGLIVAASTDPDIDIIAALVWLARRCNGGEKLLSYEDVAEEIGYDVDVDLVQQDPEDDDHPEA